MRLFVYYDRHGAIQELIAFNAPNGYGAMRAGSPGTFVSEISGLSSDAIPRDELETLASRYTVALPLPSCRLEPRLSGGTTTRSGDKA
jgi:hypothetical protein